MTNKIEDYIKLAEGATEGPYEITEALNDGKPILHAPAAGRVVCQFAYESGADSYGAFDNHENNMAFIAASRTLGPAMAKALIEAEEKMTSVSNKLQFMAMAGAGDHAQQELVKMHAILAGTLEQALATIQRIKENG
jgi:hypothetical protein